MLRGDTYQVSSVRGLRWEDFPKSGSIHAYVEVDDLSRPTHPVSLSTATGPENFVGRVRTAIEKAGGTARVEKFSETLTFRARFVPPLSSGNRVQMALNRCRRCNHVFEFRCRPENHCGRISVIVLESGHHAFDRLNGECAWPRRGEVHVRSVEEHPRMSDAICTEIKISEGGQTHV